MTVCIAAVAERGGYISLATDKMLSFGDPLPYQFESQDIHKVYRLAPNVYCLTAGDSGSAHEILRRSQPTIAQTASVQEAANLVRAEYQNFRREALIQRCLEPRGLDINTYYQMQNQLNQAIVQSIDQTFLNGDLGVTMIIAGLNNGVAQVLTLANPGVLLSNDAVGFACIGIGAPHATYSLIGAGYHRAMTRDEVHQLVLQAKTMSEKAPGVGTQTVEFQIPEEEGDSAESEVINPVGASGDNPETEFVN